MTAIRAVLLDADGVVQHPQPAWRAALDELCGDLDRTQDLLADIFAAEKPCLAGAALEPALAAVLRKWQLDVSVEDLLRIWNQIEPSAEVLAMVHTLRSAGVMVALATNQQSHRAQYMTTTLGYPEHFDHLLYSCELGHAKPDPRYFASALTRVKIAPEEGLFIDDLADNVAAAKGCGLQAEVYHLAEGVGRLHEILNAYGLRTG